MIFHLHRVEVVEEKLRDSFDNDGVVPIEERLRGFYGRFSINVIGREQIVTNEHVPREDALELLFLGVHDPELLESLESARTVSATASAEAHHLHSSGKVLLLLNVFVSSSSTSWSGCFKEVNFIRVDNSMLPLALDLEVVGD